MFTVISKFVVLPFYPVGLAIVLLTAAVFAIRAQKKKLSLILVIFAGLLLYFFSAGPLPDFLIRSFERQYAPKYSFPPASAIVLLSGGEVAKAPPRLFDEINDAGDRILYAARLARQNAAPRLIITGGNIDCIRTIKGSQAEAAGRLCTGLLGVDSSCILLENEARTTYENGVFTRKLLDSLGLPPTVILVTSALHMSRSVAIFKKQGMTVYPAPTDFIADDPAGFKTINLFPSAGVLDKSTAVLHEIYGIIAYRLLGRL
jgi:uncharacterized SAM-binding protein YcdF (DUF218 family)